MVPQHIIDEAKARGIVPGARVACACGRGEGTVDTYDKWHMVGKSIWCGMDDDRCKLEAYNSRNDRWATVLTPAPQAAAEGLVEGDSCECGPAMRAAIIELAVEIGILRRDHFCSDASPGWLNERFVTFGPKEPNNINRLAKNWYTPEAFIAKMRVEAAKPKPIRIGDHEVKFNTGSIKVGCTTIDNATVRAIAANLKD